MKSDVLFLSLMKLLNAPKCSVEIRKRIIKGFRAPISEPGLAFLGKKLRDENDEVCALVFKQLMTNEVRLENFQSDEARMLVLAEGLQTSNEKVRDACIEFLKNSVLDN